MENQIIGYGKITPLMQKIIDHFNYTYNQCTFEIKNDKFKCTVIFKTYNLTDIFNLAQKLKGTSITVDPIHELIDADLYICKKPGYNELFNSIKLFIPDLTDEKLMGLGDIDIKYKENIWYNSSFCYVTDELNNINDIYKIKTYKKSTNKIVNYRFTLEMNDQYMEDFELIIKIIENALKNV